MRAEGGPSAAHVPFERGGKQINAAGGGPVRRRQAELCQKAVVGRFERAKAVQQVEARDPADIRRLSRRPEGPLRAALM